jgi:hypothetical protein
MMKTIQVRGIALNGVAPVGTNILGIMPFGCCHKTLNRPVWDRRQPVFGTGVMRRAGITHIFRFAGHRGEWCHPHRPDKDIFRCDP